MSEYPMGAEIENAPGSGGAGAWFTSGRLATILAVFIGAAFPDVITGNASFFFRDFGFFGYPLAHYHRQSFWQGEVPLWNPLSNCGLPFLAQWNTLVLYPGSLIYLLLPLPWALNLFCLFHLYLGGLGMYWLACRWVGSRLAASAAGIAYAFNGLSLNCLMWPNNVAALAWMPFVVLATERACRKGGRTIFHAAVLGATQMLAGAPEFTLFTWLFAGGVALAGRGQPSRPRQAILRLCGVSALVAALSAGQLLPFFDLLSYSQRDTAFGTADWSMPETGWANFLVPLFRTYLGPNGVYFQQGQYWTTSYYAGIIVFALAMISLLTDRNRLTVFLGLVTGLSLVLALGNDGHLFAWLRKALPPLGYMRYPIKLVGPVAFALPLLAAFGVRACMRASVGQPCWTWRVVVIVMAVVLVLMAFIVWFSCEYPMAKENWRVTLRSGSGRAVFLVSGLALLRWRAFTDASRLGLLTRLGFLLLLLLDALTHAPRQNPTVESAALMPGLRPLRELKPLPCHGESRAMIAPDADQRLRFAMLSNSLNYYLIVRLGLFSNCNLLEGIPKLNGFFSLYLREAAEVWSMIYVTNRVTPALCDFLGVSQVTKEGTDFEWQSRSTFLPLATAGQVPVFLEDKRALENLVSPQFNPKERVILAEEDRERIQTRLGGGVRVLASQFSAQRAHITIQAKGTGLLVVAQSHCRPWRAWVDGKPVPIWRANFAFQALEVPAGSEVVVLAYRDYLFVLGLILSILSAGLCFFGWVHPSRKT